MILSAAQLEWRFLRRAVLSPHAHNCTRTTVNLTGLSKKPNGIRKPKAAGRWTFAWIYEYTVEPGFALYLFSRPWEGT